MLSTSKFTQADLESLRSCYSVGLKIQLFLFTCCIPASFVFGLVGLLKKGNGYWLATISVLLLFSICFVCLFIKSLLLFKRDIKRQVKLCGSIIIAEKSFKKGETFIYTDSKQLKKLNLSKKQFEQITEGDTLIIEISLYGRHLFRLEKNGKNLIAL